MIHLTQKHQQEIIKHCQREYPKEACGILAGKANKVEKVYQMENVSENPVTCYFMRPEEQLKVFKEMRKLNIEMLSIYHSHTGTSAYPSGRDLELAFYPEAAYMIISLKNFNNPEIRAFKIVEGKIAEEKIVVRRNILFVCIENSCRSQMAEAIANKYYWQKFVAYSAGSKPSGEVDPRAQEVMKEIGIDISKQKSKGFDEVKEIEFDYVITLGCRDVCPVLLTKQKLDWQIDDPKGKPIEFFRKVRDEIHKKIEEEVK